jgi:hypothetical protein
MAVEAAGLWVGEVPDTGITSTASRLGAPHGPRFVGDGNRIGSAHVTVAGIFKLARRAVDQAIAHRAECGGDSGGLLRVTQASGPRDHIGRRVRAEELEAIAHESGHSSLFTSAMF